jgi:hypothetical protein
MIAEFMEFLSKITSISRRHHEELEQPLKNKIVEHTNPVLCCDVRRASLDKAFRKDTNLASLVALDALQGHQTPACRSQQYQHAEAEYDPNQRHDRANCGQYKECDANGRFYNVNEMNWGY